MKRYLAVGALIAWLASVVVASAQEPTSDQDATGCMTCHQGIEPIREHGSLMMRQIRERADSQLDPDGCVVCHGGDPAATEKEAAHGGDAFYPAPGSPWVNEKTCGQCHRAHCRTQWQSLMMTEAGKIQGTAWAFGSLTGYEHKWGNYRVESLANNMRLGTKDYRQYMEKLAKLEPQVFVQAHEPLPEAPTDLSKLAEQPHLAAFTYLRNQCLRCHLAVKGRQKRGDFRGIGCSACHIPYSNEGRYEGGDKSIARDEPGHSLVHSIQATREAKVTVHGTTYSGIPVETCTTCHDRGKRIGVSFQGLMEIPYTSPFAADGGPQPALHTKHYMAMHQDLHYNKGMTCQDCHTSIDVHGDGCLAAATLGAVQIECSDCHGTPDKYPWELPLGFGDEFDPNYVPGPARGTAEDILSHQKQGTVHPARDGYLRTTRGNPYSNVVRNGNRVIVYTAAGKDLTLRPLKLIAQETDPQKQFSLEGMVAMAEIGSHMSKMECYTCHASWAPQCYGCHVKIDYSDGKMCFDWLGAGRRHGSPECAADRSEQGYDTMIPGQIEEQRSFTRWEDPPLGVNGERRVTPLAPGCQPSVTIIGPDGKPILLNHIFRTMANCEGAGAEGQLAIDISPTQPHTNSKAARSCESCHQSEKALGYGIGAGRMTRSPAERLVVDLETVDGKILPKNYQVQNEAIKGLDADWSRLVSEDGKQLQTVGHHFKGSGPLSDEQRAHVDRQGVCLACHQEIPDRSLAVSLLHHVAEYTNQLPKTSQQHNSLLKDKLLLVSGWSQVLGAAGVPVVLLVAVVWYWRRRRAANSKH